MEEEEPDEYAPIQKPSPFQKRYIGTGAVTVVSSDDTILVVSKNDPPQEPPIAHNQSVAVDEFADMDFMVSVSSRTRMSVQKGEISFTKWVSPAFLQGIKTVPVTEVDVSFSDEKQYIHLIVPLRTYVPSSGSLGSREGPWQEYTETIIDFPAYTYALTTEWQGAHNITAPYYLVSNKETLHLVDESLGFGPAIEEEDIFTCLIASVTSGVPSQIHAGAITLSQGYIAGITDA